MMQTNYTTVEIVKSFVQDFNFMLYVKYIFQKDLYRFSMKEYLRALTVLRAGALL